MDKLVQIILIFFIIQSGFTQQDIIIVSSSVDSTEIKVGQQFKYSIKAESDYINQIVYPENFNVLNEGGFLFLSGNMDTTQP